jgi:hypothetical protein
MMPLMLIILLLFYGSRTKKTFSSFLFLPVSVLIIVAFLFGMGNYIRINYHQPPEWDFLVFWLDGKVAINSGNFYIAENYQEISLPYIPSDEFRSEIIDVGFKYPPFTMFLLLPLGMFDISTAYLLWQLLFSLFCVASIYGLWRLFSQDNKISGLLLAAALLFLLRPSSSSFFYAQTNFLVLFLFLLFWHSRSKAWCGVWLALCVVVKPYMALLYLYPLFTGKWKVLAIAVLTLLTLTFLSVLAFGSDVFVSFFNNPTSKVPSYLYTEGVNQSLLATILRLTSNQVIKESPLLNPLYLGISLILAFTTVLITIKNRSNNDGWTVLSILFFALLVYPATLEHYSVFLIIPVEPKHFSTDVCFFCNSCYIFSCRL